MPHCLPPRELFVILQVGQKLAFLTVRQGTLERLIDFSNRTCGFSVRFAKDEARFAGFLVDSDTDAMLPQACFEIGRLDDFGFCNPEFSGWVTWGTNSCSHS